PTPPPPAAPPMPPTMVPPSRGFSDLGNHAPPPPAPAAPQQPAPPPLIPMAQKPRNTPAPGTSGALVVPLISLAESWPESIRKEIVQLNLVDAKVSLPVEAVEHGLKQGSISLPWKIIRSWMPGVVLPGSPQDQTMLELPLKVVAPLFVARQKDSKQQKK